jgi:uncharacterized Tic20 family protein
VRDENYGIQRDWKTRPAAPDAAPGAAPVSVTVPVSAADERAWAALAHLSALLNLFTGLLGPVAAFVVWLVYRERSSVVARHAMRSVVYQSVWLVALFLGWSVTFFLTAFVVGILLWPVMGVLTLAFFGHALYEAYLAYRGDGAFVYH